MKIHSSVSKRRLMEIAKVGQFQRCSNKGFFFFFFFFFTPQDIASTTDHVHSRVVLAGASHAVIVPYFHTPTRYIKLQAISEVCFVSQHAANVERG